jgi:hypothetical protein
MIADPRLITGYTMASYSVGVSLVTALPVANVIGRQIESYSGGTLFILGQTGLVGIALAQANVTHDFPGGAPMFISARGATATANVVSYLTNLAPGATVITG